MVKMVIEIVDFPINSMVDLSSSFFVNVYEAGYFFRGEKTSEWETKYDQIKGPSS